MASPTQWTWVWASSGRQWRIGRPGKLQSMGSQRVRHDWTTTPRRLRSGPWLPLACYSFSLSLWSHMCSLGSCLWHKVSPWEQAAPWVGWGKDERGRGGGRKPWSSVAATGWGSPSEEEAMFSHPYLHQKANSLFLPNSQVCGSVRGERGVIISKHFTSSHGHTQAGA